MKRLLLCAALIAWSGVASAVVYKWVDAQGKLQYGDHPPDGVHAEIVELLGNHVPKAAPARPATPSAAGNAAATPPATQAAVKQAVDNDVAQAREKQCADAQEHYKKVIEGRRLYKTGPDGERQYLTSDEVDAERLSAKNDVDSLCNGTT
jgi:predicted lipid-binding transport protein (Tim44 family)